jgi:hypothetical protein
MYESPLGSSRAGATGPEVWLKAGSSWVRIRASPMGVWTVASDLRTASNTTSAQRGRMPDHWPNAPAEAGP